MAKSYFQFLVVFILVFQLSFSVYSQNFPPQITELESELETMKAREVSIKSEIEGLKLEHYGKMVRTNGLPKAEAGEKIIHHHLISLVYSEKHEQAKWVAHLVPPEVMQGNVGRTNDFRPDPMIKTGSAVEADYFLKKQKEDGSFDYDGFGLDRGHLAPSADFRWSQTALSESYFYSNMSPQYPDFNRGVWADLEARMRGYIFRNPKSTLYIVTGPVLIDDLPHIERGMNKVSIPKQYFKVVADLNLKKAIAFVLPNEASVKMLSTFAMSIDDAEKLTGIDFFPEIDDELENMMEAQKIVNDWLPEAEAGDVEPLPATKMKRNHFNTSQARAYMDKNDKVAICGKVVSTRTSRKGNIMMNLDRLYPNQVFTVFIKKEFIHNFSYDPLEELKGQVICVSGKVANLGGVPAMFIENEKQLTFYTGK